MCSELHVGQKPLQREEKKKKKNNTESLSVLKATTI